MKLPGGVRKLLKRPGQQPASAGAAGGAPVRPIGPVPEFAPFPPARYLYAVNAVPRVFGGRTSSIITKARVFAERAGVRSTLVTFLHSAELADIEHELRARGAISDELDLVCLHDYYPDDTVYAGEPVDHPVDHPEWSWLKDPDQAVYRYFDAEGTYRRYRRYDHAGRLIVQDHFSPNRARTVREEFRPNGTLRRRVYMDLHHNLPRQEIHYRADQTPSFNVWWVIDPVTLQPGVERVTVFDAEGRAVAVHDSLDPVNHLCLDRLIGEQPAFVMVEDRNLDRCLLKYARANVRSIYVLHSAHIKEPYDNIAAIRPAYRPVLEARKRVDAVVFLTATQRAEAEARYGRSESFKVLPHSVRPPRLTAGIERDPDLVVMVARLDPVKQLDHAIAAFATVATRLPSARLEIYGKGPELASLRTLIADLGLGGRVKLMGFTTEPDLVYQRASLCLLTSRLEGAPLTLQEAMSYGCPVISYDLRYGPRDLIEDGRSGLLVPYGDRAALAQRIAQALSDPEQLARLSAGAQERARDFSEEAFAARWGGLFNELDAAGRAAART